MHWWQEKKHHLRSVHGRRMPSARQAVTGRVDVGPLIWGTTMGYYAWGYEDKGGLRCPIADGRELLLHALRQSVKRFAYPGRDS